MAKDNTLLIAGGSIAAVTVIGLVLYFVTRQPSVISDCTVCTEGTYIDKTCPDFTVIHEYVCQKATAGDCEWVQTTETCPVPNQPPVPVIEVIGQTDYTIHISILDTMDPDGTIVESMIDWGDGTTTWNPPTWDDISHIYAAAGNYTITLHVRDDDGLDAEVAQAVSMYLLRGTLRATQVNVPALQRNFTVLTADNVPIFTSAWGVDWVPIAVGVYTLRITDPVGAVLMNIPIAITQGQVTCVKVDLLNLIVVENDINAEC